MLKLIYQEKKMGHFSVTVFVSNVYVSVCVIYFGPLTVRIKCIADWEYHISIGASNNLWLPQLSTCISWIDISRITIEYFVQKISTTLTFHQVISQDCVIHFPVWRRQKPWPWRKSYATHKPRKKRKCFRFKYHKHPHGFSCSHFLSLNKIVSLICDLHQRLRKSQYNREGIFRF